MLKDQSHDFPKEETSIWGTAPREHYLLYEAEKRRLQSLNLSPREYQDMIMELSEQLEI